jgi:hypothetical protein
MPDNPSKQAAFKLEPWFLDALLRRLEQERSSQEAAKSPLGRSKLDVVPAISDNSPYGTHTIPSRAHLELLIHVAFWASLQKEEGQSFRFTISYLTPSGHSECVLTFVDPLRYDIRHLTKLAPAVREPEATILVCPDTTATLVAWGVCDFNHSLLSIKVLDPGRLIVSFGTRNIAVIAGSESVFISETLRERSQRIWSRLGSQLGDVSTKDSRVRVILDALKIMRFLGRGGTLVVVPEDDTWKEGVGPIAYFGVTPLKTVHNLLKEWDELTAFKKLGVQGHLDDLRRMIDLWPEFERASRSLANMSAVDGATLVSPALSIVGFGAKIKYDPKEADLTPVYRYDSISEHLKNFRTSFAELGGMRHQSAAHFVAQHHNALALVVSQDGNLSAYTWDEDTPSGHLVAYTQLEFVLF